MARPVPAALDAGDRRRLADLIVASEYVDKRTHLNTPKVPSEVQEFVRDVAADRARAKGPHLTDEAGVRTAAICALGDAIAKGWSRADLLEWVDRVAPEE